MEMKGTEEKREYIHIRVAVDEKAEFAAICRAKAINQSEWIRQKIREFTAENSKNSRKTNGPWRIPEGVHQGPLVI